MRVRAPILALLLIATVARDATAQDVDPLVAIGSSDPVALARIVERLGDDAVLARLAAEDAEDADGVSADARLAAIRASVALRAPERALDPLAAIAAGRDPDLAPAAAYSILVIARALDPRDLDAREVMRAELAPALAAIARLAADETARPDLRRAAAIAAELLGHLGIAPPAE